MKIKAALAAISLLLVQLFVANPAAVSEETTPKIAIAYDIGFLGDNSFNDAVNRALIAAKKKYNLVEPYIREVPTSGTALDRLTRIRFLANNGYSLIIAVGSGYRDTIRRAAIEYPEIQFAIINDKALGQLNISNISFREDQGAYVAGLVAGLVSKRKVVGFIGSESELLASFKSGVKAVNPKVKVVDISYPDELSALKAGLKRIDIGYSTWDGDAQVLTTVLEDFPKKVKLIVETPDQYFAALPAAQNVVLASVNKVISKSINDLIRTALAEETLIDVIDENAGIYGREYNLKNKGISLAFVSPVSASVKQRLTLEISKYLKQEPVRKN